MAKRKISRETARAIGSLVFNGKPCIHGHGDIRYVSSGRCVECAKGDARKREAKIRAQKALKIPSPPVPVLPMVPHPQPTSWWASLKRRVFGEGGRA